MVKTVGRSTSSEQQPWHQSEQSNVGSNCFYSLPYVCIPLCSPDFCSYPQVYEWPASWRLLSNVSAIQRCFHLCTFITHGHFYLCTFIIHWYFLLCILLSTDISTPVLLPAQASLDLFSADFPPRPTALWERAQCPTQGIPHMSTYMWYWKVILEIQKLNYRSLVTFKAMVLNLPNAVTL